jgi:hypothetical protein
LEEGIDTSEAFPDNVEWSPATPALQRVVLAGQKGRRWTKLRANGVTGFMSFLEKVFKKSDAIVFRKIGEACILVPIRQGVGDMESICTLNETAARNWDLLDGRAKAGIQTGLGRLDARLRGHDRKAHAVATRKRNSWRCDPLSATLPHKNEASLCNVRVN